MPTEDAYSSRRLVMSHFGTCICSNVETNLSWTCIVSGLLIFEHPSVLLFCFNKGLYSVNSGSVHAHYKSWMSSYRGIPFLILHVNCLWHTSCKYTNLKPITLLEWNRQIWGNTLISLCAEHIKVTNQRHEKKNHYSIFGEAIKSLNSLTMSFQ